MIDYLETDFKSTELSTLDALLDDTNQTSGDIVHERFLRIGDQIYIRSLRLLNPKTETMGRIPDRRYRPLGEGVFLTEEARQIVRKSEHPKIAKEAEKLIYTLQEEIDALQARGIELSQLPPFHAFNIDDGSILVEWVFDDFRVGFTTEPGPDDSGWYLVSNSKLGHVNASGYLSNEDNVNIIAWLLNFVITHT